MKTIHFFALFVLIMASSPLAKATTIDTLDSINFDYRYEFDTLPSEMDLDGNGVNDFEFVGDPESMTDGVWSMNTVANSYSYFLSSEIDQIWANSGITFETGYTIEVRAKVNSVDPASNLGAAYVQASPESSYATSWLNLDTDVQSWGYADIETPANNSDDFHTFRIIQKSGFSNFSVWRDGAVIYNGVGSGYSGDLNHLVLGDKSGGALGGSVDFDYLRFTPGAYMATGAEEPPGDPFQPVCQLPPGDNNPRNSEGDFVKLNDGRILFVYTHFTGGGNDHATAHLEGRFSSDGGKTWTTDDTLILPNEGDMNIMSVSLLRLQDNRIAMFYMKKNGLDDCRPMMRVSTDEAQTWSEPVKCIPDVEADYYVLNNDRVVQLENGRLLVPVAQHEHYPDGTNDWAGVIHCYISDDAGATWQASESSLRTTREDGSRVITQEPGVVELNDGRIMMFARTDGGSQYVSYSSDDGNTWSELQPSSIISPRSPATIERIPGTDTLLMAWNDHENIDPLLQGLRTPYTVAISSDEGLTWEKNKNLYTDPYGHYCYTGMHFEGEHVLLAHCAGDRRTGGLNETYITRVPLDWITEESILIPGDANGDGRVDGSDVTILAGNWQAGVGDPNLETITWAMGDFNGDGQIDGSDVTILAGNWQVGVDTSAASVPEPSAILLILSAIVGKHPTPTT